MKGNALRHAAEGRQPPDKGVTDSIALQAGSVAYATRGYANFTGRNTQSIVRWQSRKDPGQAKRGEW